MLLRLGLLLFLATITGAVAALPIHPDELDTLVTREVPAIPEASVCDAGGKMCDGEEGLDYDSQKVSLLQTELQVVGMSLPRSAARAASALEVPPNTDAIPHHASITDAEPQLELLQGKVMVAHPRTASSIARAVAWLHRLSVKSGVGAYTVTGVAVVLLLGVALLVAAWTVFGGSRQVNDIFGDGQSSKLAEEPRRPAASRNSPAKAGLTLPGRSSPLMSGSLSPSVASAQLLSAQSLQSPQMSTPALQAEEAKIRAQLQQEAAAQKADVPAICPSLVLPHTEARFKINRLQIEQLRGAATGSLDIKGTSGKKLLHALVCQSPDGRQCLMLSSCGCEDDPRACVFTSPTDFEIFGKAGKFYGWLKAQGADEATLYHSGIGGESKEVMQIQMSEEPFRRDAYTMNGQLLGSASRDSEAWSLQAKPGADAILITSVILALQLLR